MNSYIYGMINKNDWHKHREMFFEMLDTILIKPCKGQNILVQINWSFRVGLEKSISF